MGLMDWQLAIVAVIVAAALVYVVRKFMRQLKGKEKAGCDKCD